MKIEKSGYHGIKLPAYDIGFDMKSADARYIFTSHAHGDHMPYKGNMEVIASPATVELMKARGFKGEATKLSFNQPYQTEDAQVTLYPAGHVLGSAMIFVETEEGNVLYTGDYRTPPSPASEGFEIPENVDHFITEATFGMPIYRWPSYDELKAQIHQFAHDALNEDYTPIFLGYSLGKSQEIMHLLADFDHPVQVHGAACKLCQVYEDFDINLGEYEPYDRDTVEGNILVTTSSSLSNGVASNVRNKRIAYCSGWAVHEARRTQLTVDALIPLSDHLDFFALLDLCDRLQPDTVYITHTPNPRVLQHYLQQRNFNSRFLDMEVEDHD